MGGILWFVGRTRVLVSIANPCAPPRPQGVVTMRTCRCSARLGFLDGRTPLLWGVQWIYVVPPSPQHIECLC